MGSINNSPLVFNFIRRKPELVRPAKPTPTTYGTNTKPKLLLSDIDDQDGLRFQIPIIQIYSRHDDLINNEQQQQRDPVNVIREALARTLVFYYPFAGRLKEGPGRKLYVDCTDEGVVFIEADAEVTLEEFGQALRPPFPCLEELLYDVPGTSGILNCPLLLIQVTRLKCGGFIFAQCFNHTMCDATGIVQFMAAIGEIAKGANSPSILPVWEREILCARSPPRVTCKHHEYDEILDVKKTIVASNDMIQRSFFFSPKQVSILKSLVPPNLKKCTTFEILTACLWRCRTIAIQPDPEEEVMVMCCVNARGKFNPPLPIGYYGNVIAFPVAFTTAKNLCNQSLAYAIDLIKKAKTSVTEEYMKSLSDLMVIKGRPNFNGVRPFLVSDVTRVGFDNVDFGWGKPVYGGLAKSGVGTIPGVISFYMSFINNMGEKGIIVPICLPTSAMTRFENELHNMLKSNSSSICNFSKF